jgi:hypothetical protein
MPQVGARTPPCSRARFFTHRGDVPGYDRHP